ncbi:hypothetical protein BKK79_37080 (plasmid) [Cupriavidus sp. USMAA2-4]|nr:hypothetical protein BKK79_37080 [Cupriavidus sp. USMAA2-4]
MRTGTPAASASVPLVLLTVTMPRALRLSSAMSPPSNHTRRAPMPRQAAAAWVRMRQSITPLSSGWAFTASSRPSGACMAKLRSTSSSAPSSPPKAECTRS